VSALWPVNVRLGQLTPSRLDRWWTVAADTESAQVGEEVAALLRAHAVPWLDALATRDALVRAVHENPQAIARQAAVRDRHLLEANAAERLHGIDVDAGELNARRLHC
jgi:hypothetical protein